MPGVLATLWTPSIAPTTALTLGTAGYGFVAVPKNMIHFTTATGAQGIARTGGINASTVINSNPLRITGLFGPGVYMARVGGRINGFLKAEATTPILISTPAGTARIIPYLVYVRWGYRGVAVK